MPTVDLPVSPPNAADGVRERDLLEVTDLTVDFGTGPVVDHLSFTVRAGERVGIIGESGSGKSLTALADRGTGARQRDRTGSVRWKGAELLGRPTASCRSCAATASRWCSRTRSTRSIR